ncbi:MAG: alpha/beta hydrolase [Xanthomonadales bacterium]|nr:alpha/beta hydrolase [Xanthomonadales bacterium]
MTIEQQYPDCAVVETAKNPRFTVIWLHGLGADGHDFEPIVPQLGLSQELQAAGVRFIFPNAASRPVTINGGMSMPAWYDIKGMDLRRDQDEQGIADSSKRISDMIDAEIAAGRKPAEIVLAGFSQGGAMALHVGLRYPQKLAGIMALSCYLLFPEQLETLDNPAAAGMDVFAAHGSQDPVVPYAAGKTAASRLSKLGYQVQWQVYTMAHAVCQQEIKDIGRWLSQRFTIK